MAEHPLEPLTADEFRRTSAILRRDSGVTESFRFASIELREPPKATVKSWTAGQPVSRASFAVLWDRTDGRTYEAVVDLTNDKVQSFTAVPGVVPNFTVDEWHECDAAMRIDPRVAAALAQRGIADLDLVLFDVWTYGRALMPEKYRDRRLGWCDVWCRSTPAGNPYAHLVAGLKLIVDMNTMQLLEIDDNGPIDPAPVMGEYAPDLVPGLKLRDDLRPLHITQPDGVSFALEDGELRWQRWSMRLGFNYREGPVIYQVRYDDSGTQRDIAYRLSFAEMVVPYRDPTFDHYRRTAYDIGEWGLGFMTTSLERGCDCLGAIRYVDAVLHDTRGDPYEIPNAICIHEEDNGVLWKHVDGETGAEVRRMRRLVVSCHVTVANYEYLVYWRFYQDGSIECEVRATGIMVTTPLPEGEQPPYGRQVDVRTYAPYHQHFLVARLDLDVDGEQNTVYEVDSLASPVSADNPYGLALATRATPVRREAESGRDYDWSTQRAWKVVNPNKTNAVGDPVAYKLVPTACIPPMMDPSTPQYLRAPVIGHQLWVTREHPDERWPCGAYPTQSDADDGLTRWIADDESLEDADVVLWYVFGIHHVTRVEDWPVMPVDTISFWLKPFGFFDRNPALDVAPSPHSQQHRPRRTSSHPEPSVHFAERVDPELAAALPSIPDFDLNDLDAARQKRLALAAAGRASWVPPDGVLVADHRVVTPDGRPGPRVRVYSPAALAGRVPCLYWVHGGGFVIGDLEQDDPLLADLVDRVGCVAASVDWRRAPEHPFPAAPEDAYDGLVWVATHAAQLLVDPRRIVVGGASAGGGLAAALAHMARDRGGPSIAHQILVYPMLDDREITVSSRSAVHPRLWNVERNRIAWRHYLGELSGSDHVPPYAAPARATDVALLPPTWLATGELDLFADENIAYAQSLMAAGVSTELHVYAGAYHGFDLLAPTAAVSRRYLRDRQEMFDRTLRPG